MTVVLCKITRLYENGIKKSRPLPPVAGNLVMFKCDDGTNRQYRIRAVLRGLDGKGLMPMLDFAVVERISDGAGIFIKGTEMVCLSQSIKSQIDRYPQTRWCEVVEVKRV